MKPNLGLKYKSRIELEITPSEFKKRCESLNPDTNILRTSYKRRQVSFIARQLKFINENEFEIKKKGDFLNPLKSGRGKIKGQLIEKESNNLMIDYSIQPNYNEFGMNILFIIIIILNLVFGNPDSKYLIAIGITGILIFVLSFQFLLMKLNIKCLNKEFLDFIDLLKRT